MVYTLLYTRSAVKDIEKLDTVVKKRLKKALEKLAEQPLSQATTRLSHSSLGQHRLRIGNHRVVFDIHGNSIVILRIRHRREVYR